MATPAKRPAAKKTPPDRPAGNGGAAPAGASPWEWVVAGIGAVLVAAALGYLVYFAETAPAGPPRIALHPGQIQSSGDGYVVSVGVTNEGGTTAAAVEIEGILTRDGAAPESATATLDYVPRFSTRQAGLYFSADPRDGTLSLRALGYAEP